MKDIAGKPHQLALVHLTYNPSPLPSAWGEGRERRDHQQTGSNKIHTLAAANTHSLCLRGLHTDLEAHRQHSS